MSVWHSSVNGSQPLPHSWPVFWGQQAIMGWAGGIRVDGQTYSWLGDDGNLQAPANVTDVRITPTRSIFIMQAGPMNLTVTFLSPIEPSDWVLQSLPFSYVSVEASSLDGLSHDVQVYSDISAEWLSGDRSSVVNWTPHPSSSSVYHEIVLQKPQQDVENAHQAQDGVAYYAMAARTGLTWEIALDKVSRPQFQQHGSLTNSTLSNGPTTISPSFTVYAIAVDLGQIQSTPQPVTWAVGYVRNPSITYTAPNFSVQQLKPYFVTKYGDDIGPAIDDFTSSFADLHERAVALDQQIMGNASKVSEQYVDLVSLAARQTIGSLDITVSTDSNGNPDASDVRVFMKDNGVSTPDDRERINPVERIYAALPALLYLNASLIGPMLAPLLDAQETSTGTPYAAQDLGLAYPSATGPHGAHNQGIEQTGNMLIMLYAHARFSGDGSLVHKHYNLTKKWADYLVNNSLTPSTDQFTADNEGNANTTNLAIKGIIGVKAMAEISRALKEDIDASQYDNHAAALVGQWQSLAVSSTQPHFLRVYGNQQSWALMYNLYADRLLGTNLVSDKLLQDQTSFYKTLLISAPVFGLAIDDTLGTTSAAWQLFAAATISDNGVRDALIEGAWNRAASNLTSGAFADNYDSGTGQHAQGTGGPAVGAMFSLLALNLPNKTIDTSISAGQAGSGLGSGGDNGHKTPVGAIAGGVVGGIFLVSLIGLGVFLFFRRRRRIRSPEEEEKLDDAGQPHRPALAPYTYSPPGSYPAIYDTALDPGAYGRTNESGSLGMVGSNPSLDPIPLDGSSPARSSKLRERSLNARAAYAPSVSGSSNAASNTASASSREPLSPGESRTVRSHTGSGSRSGTSTSLSPTDVLGLRAEVENLRRVMQELRAERLEPPPEYDG